MLRFKYFTRCISYKLHPGFFLLFLFLILKVFTKRFCYWINQIEWVCAIFLIKKAIKLARNFNCAVIKIFIVAIKSSISNFVTLLERKKNDDESLCEETARYDARMIYAPSENEYKGEQISNYMKINLMSI